MWAKHTDKHDSELRGFTIVELLVVIVVIGILATVTIVAYNGIQSRAQLARLQSETNSGSKKLELYRVENTIYPISVTDCPAPAPANICLPSTADESLTYISNLPTTSSTYMINLITSYELTIMGSTQFLYTSSAEKTGASEFMQYVDLAPIINRYGLKKYQLSFDIRSANTTSASSIYAYFQNGSDSRYGGLSTSIPVTTAYSHQIITFTAAMGNSAVAPAMLAFYGTYGTGNVPFVKNLKVQLAP